MDNVPFKPRAYEKAAISISALEEDVEEIYMKSCVEGFLIQQLSKVDLKELILKVKANYNKYRSLEACHLERIGSSLSSFQAPFAKIEWGRLF